jgi:hypothetical protein
LDGGKKNRADLVQTARLWHFIQWKAVVMPLSISTFDKSLNLERTAIAAETIP